MDSSDSLNAQKLPDTWDIPCYTTRKRCIVHIIFASNFVLYEAYWRLALFVFHSIFLWRKNFNNHHRHQWWMHRDLIVQHYFSHDRVVIILWHFFFAFKWFNMSSIKRLKYFSRKWFRGKSWGATEFLIFYQIHVRFKVRNKFVLFSYLFIIIIIINIINDMSVTVCWFKDSGLSLSSSHLASG